MTYTIKFDMWFDSEEIFDEKSIKYLLKEALDGSPVEASDIKLLEIND